MNKITKHSVPHTRKQLPSPTLIQIGSIVPGKLRVTLVLGSGGLQLRTPPLEHLLKYGTQPRPEERLREHRMKLAFRGKPCKKTKIRLSRVFVFRNL